MTTGDHHADAAVELVPYDLSWPALFDQERAVLASTLAPWLAGPIEHIGSTAVPGLIAKPVIDIMAAVENLDASRASISAVAEIGYVYFPYRADVMHWFCKPSRHPDPPPPSGSDGQPAVDRTACVSGRSPTQSGDGRRLCFPETAVGETVQVRPRGIHQCQGLLRSECRGACLGARGDSVYLIRARLMAPEKTKGPRIPPRPFSLHPGPISDRPLPYSAPSRGARRSPLLLALPLRIRLRLVHHDPVVQVRHPHRQVGDEAAHPH